MSSGGGGTRREDRAKVGRAVFNVFSAKNFEISTHLVFKCVQTPGIGSCVSFEGKSMAHKVTRNLALLG